MDRTPHTRWRHPYRVLPPERVFTIRVKVVETFWSRLRKAWLLLRGRSFSVSFLERNWLLRKEDFDE